MGMLRILLYVSVIFLLVHYYLDIPKFSYVFKVKSIKSTAYKHSGRSYNSEKLQQDLYHQYRNYVSDGKQWFPAYTGGLQGAVTILYASLTEILVLYHAEMETTGSSGRHYMNVSVTVLTGAMEESTYNLVTSNTLKPGDNKVFRVGETSTVKLSRQTALLIYGRGFVPLTMGYWLSDSLFSKHDPLLVISTIYYYIKAVVMSISWEWFQQMYNYLLKVLKGGFVYLLESTQYTINHFPEIFHQIVTWIYESCINLWDRFMALLVK